MITINKKLKRHDSKLPNFPPRISLMSSFDNCKLFDNLRRVSEPVIIIATYFWFILFLAATSLNFSQITSIVVSENPILCLNIYHRQQQHSKNAVFLFSF